MSSTLQSGARFRAYPDRGVASLLRRWVGCQRAIYNGKVEEDRLFAAQRRLELASGKADV
ncbi:MAG: transposase, partial [Caballeronia mineralivorans]|nr:transposase [Caballeronia mineralivorans]